jgi:hypothetical protein
MEAGVNIVDRGALPGPDLVAPTEYRTDLPEQTYGRVHFTCKPKILRRMHEALNVGKKYN